MLAIFFCHLSLLSSFIIHFELSSEAEEVSLSFANAAESNELIRKLVNKGLARRQPRKERENVDSLSHVVLALSNTIAATMKWQKRVLSVIGGLNRASCGAFDASNLTL